MRPARNRTNRIAIIRGSENAFSQILRIRLPLTPKHLTLRFAITGILKITNGTQFVSPRKSSQSENALAASDPIACEKVGQGLFAFGHEHMDDRKMRLTGLRLDCRLEKTQR